MLLYHLSFFTLLSISKAQNVRGSSQPRPAIAQQTPIPTLTVPAANAPTANQVLLQRQETPAPTISPTLTNGYYISEQYITIPGFTNEHATKHPETITIAIPTCHQTIEPDQNGYIPAGSCGALYNYYPSFPAALATSIVFAALTIAHIALAVMYKTPYSWVITMGSLWETLGFGIRALSTKHQQNSGLVLVSQIFVLLVPLWINAFIYVVLARLINYVHPRKAIFHIPAPLLSTIFVVLDFVTFVIQIAGGLMGGPTAPVEVQMKGIHIYMGGIGMQQFFIVVFVVIAVKFQLEMKQYERSRRLDSAKIVEWKKLLRAVYIGLTFITIRITYRLIEFSGGQDQEKNPLPYREIYLYVLEVVPMLFAVGLYLGIHPGRALVGPEAEMPGIWSTIKIKARGGGYQDAPKRLADEDGEMLVSGFELSPGDRRGRDGKYGHGIV